MFSRAAFPGHMLVGKVSPSPDQSLVLGTKNSPASPDQSLVLCTKSDWWFNCMSATEIIFTARTC